MLDGPGFFTLDTSLSRRFVIAEQKAVQFRVETSNVTNRTKFSLPETRVDVRGQREFSNWGCGLSSKANYFRPLISGKRLK